MKLTEKRIRSKLSEVMDPELNISIVDLGLIYGITVKGDKVRVLMTLTTIGCPLISIIEEEMRARLADVGVTRENLKIDLTFDPPWSMEKMSEKAKAMLGIG